MRPHYAKFTSAGLDPRLQPDNIGPTDAMRLALIAQQKAEERKGGRAIGTDLSTERTVVVTADEQHSNH